VCEYVLYELSEVMKSADKVLYNYADAHGSLDGLTLVNFCELIGLKV